MDTQSRGTRTGHEVTGGETRSVDHREPSSVPRTGRGNERGFWGMSPIVSCEPGGRCADRKQHELNSGRGHKEEKQEMSPAPRAQMEAREILR